MTSRGLAVDVPVSWITAAWWDSLTLAERGVYVSALAWSMGQFLDGDVPRGALRFIDGDTATVVASLNRFVEIGRAETTDGGWRFIDWNGMQAQNSATEIEDRRRKNRERQATFRRRTPRTKDSGSAGEIPKTNTAPTDLAPRVTRDVTGEALRDREGYVGKGRAGNGEEVESSPQKTADKEYWPVTRPPTSPDGDEYRF